ncbi:MAG TPA: CPBP family glutamic-type intramembrane protease [Polyangia bacterium]|nr:CPBP family glutamic-type intramembrane protease [Polyangia bacterium]
MSAPSTDAGISTLRLTRLFIGLRWRLLRNALRRRRARGGGTGLALPLAMGLLTSVAYVGLFSQSFGAIVAATDLGGQRAALALIAGAIAFGTLAAKAASGDAALAGTPENEFLLTRPTSLPSLVVARSLAEAVTDPFGALFLFPVLVAAALTWKLGPGAWLAAAVTSMLAQVAIAATAQAVQILLVRYTPPRRRRLVWMALRLVASATLALLWMTGTWVLRAPRALAQALDAWRAPLAWSPGALLARPLVAARLGDPPGVAVGLALLAALAAGLLALAFAVARRAGMHGWEEAGAAWAEAEPQRSSAAARRARPLTAASKDFRLIVRDRSQLLALIAAPIIFVGVQIFGAAGWGWSTASLTRVAMLAFSLCLYMATIGPLAHMQAERRSFWILRTVPVSIGRLMFAKARTWAVALGALAALAFLLLSSGVPETSATERLALAVWVAIGAAGLAFIAVALACQSADLSDEQRPAIGPATIYLFLAVGALYNVVLGEVGAERWRWLALYLFVGLALWSTGMKQAAECLDPEAHRRRAVRLGDAAVLVLLSALGNRAVVRIVDGVNQPGSADAALTKQIAGVAVSAVLAVATALYLWHRRDDRGLRARMTWAPATAIALAVGTGLGLSLRGGGWTVSLAQLPVVLTLVASEELIFRGCLQRAWQERWTGRSHPVLVSAAAAALTVAISALATGGPWLLALAGPLLPSLVWAATGRTSSSFLARATVLAVVALLPSG